LVGFGVNKDLGAGGSQGGAEKLKGTKDLGMCGERWVDSGATEKVQGEFCLWK